MATDQAPVATTAAYEYEPINRYQTRLIRLHGDNGDPESPIECTLYIADLLDAAFGDGLGLRARAGTGENDSLVSYDALSYVWGSGDHNKTIECNGKSLNVTENLFNALVALRPHTGFIWIDQICIDQRNNDEKGFQVRNILSIYQKAAQVVVWLGRANDNARNLLDLAAERERASTQELQDSALRMSRALDNACAALEDLYTNTWFRRIWGDNRFPWHRFLSSPERLLKDNLSRNASHLQDNSSERTRHQVHVKSDQKSQSFSDLVTRLKELHKVRLRCFENFKCGSRISQHTITKTLMKTSVLETSNRRDYIYATLGMTKFPARPMSIAEWLVARESAAEPFIPIDYSATYESILCTVTWAILMTHGLQALMHIITQRKSSPDSNHSPLPSWVVDWQQAASTLQKFGLNNKDNAWHSVSHIEDPCYYEPTRHPRPGEHRPNHRAAKAQITLYKENASPTQPLTKLAINAIKDPHLQIQDDWICFQQPDGQSRKLWHMRFGLLPGDVAVYPRAIRRNALLVHDKWLRPGPWVLRPTAPGSGEYTLLACLTSPWEKYADSDELLEWEMETSATTEPLSRCVVPSDPETENDLKLKLGSDPRGEYERYIIV